MLKVDSGPASGIHRLSSDGDGRMSAGLSLHANSSCCSRVASMNSGLLEEQPCEFMKLQAVLKCVSEICYSMTGPEQDILPSVELPSTHLLFWLRSKKTEAS